MSSFTPVPTDSSINATNNQKQGLTSTGATRDNNGEEHRLRSALFTANDCIVKYLDTLWSWDASSTLLCSCCGSYGDVLFSYYRQLWSTMVMLERAGHIPRDMQIWIEIKEMPRVESISSRQLRQDALLQVLICRSIVDALFTDLIGILDNLKTDIQTILGRIDTGKSGCCVPTKIHWIRTLRIYYGAWQRLVSLDAAGFLDAEEEAKWQHVEEGGRLLTLTAVDTIAIAECKRNVLVMQSIMQSVHTARHGRERTLAQGVAPSAPAAAAAVEKQDSGPMDYFGAGAPVQAAVNKAAPPRPTHNAADQSQQGPVDYYNVE